jgi:tetratricopeptide (TPR) repeat protein
VHKALIGFAVAWTVTLASPLCSGQSLSDRNLKVAGSGENVAAAPAHVPRGYAVVIGIAGYRMAGVAPLQYPETDAEAIYRVLISQQGGAFPAENVHKLLGKDATLANIRREIEEWLPTVAQAEDRVVVYFSGHGVVAAGRGYLAPWDVDPQRIEDTAYPMQTLGNTLANHVKARWKALFADACHSGRINSETTDENIAEQLNSVASQYLSFTATLGRQKSYEDPALNGGFGLFSYFLMEALKGNADNNPCDGVVTADELVEYVRAEVMKYARSRGTQQTPHANSDYEPAMPMGWSMKCGIPNSEPSLSGSLVVESEADGVEIFVDDDLMGHAARSVPLTVPGLAQGAHVVKAAKPGYRPEIQNVAVLPGRATTVTVHLRFRITVKHEAEMLDMEGLKLYGNRHSSVNPLAQFAAAHTQKEQDLRRARQFFIQAIQADGGYAAGHYDLGRVDQALGDRDRAREAFLDAIQLDPTFVAPRLEYADSSIATGDPDEAIRQLVEAARFEPNNDRIHSLLSGAYWEKSSWKDCSAEARQALVLNPQNYDADFRLADCLREIAVVTPSEAQKSALFLEARTNYQAFVNLTNFSTSRLGWIGFHVFVGVRYHSDRTESYKEWREAAFLGLCICEKNLGNLLRAREDCSRAVAYAPGDAMAYFFLGNVHRDLFNWTKSCDSAKSARSSYRKVIALNPRLDEARNAANYLDQLDGLRDALRRRGCTDF